MANNRKFNLPFRRKREGKTDYKLRKALLTSGTPRLVVRKSLKHITAQIIQYHPQGDKVLAAASTQELKKYGGNSPSTPAAYLLGILIARKALKHHLQEVILDAGLQPSTRGSKIYAVVQGASDSGLQVPHNPKILPSPERIQGKHLQKENALKQEKFKECKAKLLQI